MGCNCGQKKVIGLTSGALEDQQRIRQAEFEKLVQAEMEKSADQPLPRVVRK